MESFKDIFKKHGNKYKNVVEMFEFCETADEVIKREPHPEMYDLINRYKELYDVNDSNYREAKKLVFDLKMFMRCCSDIEKNI